MTQETIQTVCCLISVAVQLTILLHFFGVY